MTKTYDVKPGQWYRRDGFATGYFIYRKVVSVDDPNSSSIETRTFPTAITTIKILLDEKECTVVEETSVLNRLTRNITLRLLTEYYTLIDDEHSVTMLELAIL